MIETVKRTYFTICRKYDASSEGESMEVYVATDRHYDKEPVLLDLSDKNLIIRNKIPEGWDYRVYHIATVPSPMTDEAFSQFLAELDAFASLEG